MNNLTNEFINQQANQFAGAMMDSFLEECNQFMIAFLDLPKVYVDGDGIEQKTGFQQSYGWSMDKGYLLQTHATMTTEGLVQEMSMYQKKVSKYCKVKSTYVVESAPAEAPAVSDTPAQTVAVPLNTTPTTSASSDDVSIDNQTV